MPKNTYQEILNNYRDDDRTFLANLGDNDERHQCSKVVEENGRGEHGKDIGFVYISFDLDKIEDITKDPLYKALHNAKGLSDSGEHQYTKSDFVSNREIVKGKLIVRVPVHSHVHSRRSTKLLFRSQLEASKEIPDYGNKDYGHGKLASALNNEMDLGKRKEQLNTHNIDGLRKAQGKLFGYMNPFASLNERMHPIFKHGVETGRKLWEKEQRNYKYLETLITNNLDKDNTQAAVSLGKNFASYNTMTSTIIDNSHYSALYIKLDEKQCTSTLSRTLREIGERHPGTIRMVPHPSGNGAIFSIIAEKTLHQEICKELRDVMQANSKVDGILSATPDNAPTPRLSRKDKTIKPSGLSEQQRRYNELSQDLHKHKDNNREFLPRIGLDTSAVATNIACTQVVKDTKNHQVIIKLDEIPGNDPIFTAIGKLQQRFPGKVEVVNNNGKPLDKGINKGVCIYIKGPEKTFDAITKAFNEEMEAARQPAPVEMRSRLSIRRRGEDTVRVVTPKLKSSIAGTSYEGLQDGFYDQKDEKSGFVTETGLNKLFKDAECTTIADAKNPDRSFVRIKLNHVDGRDRIFGILKEVGETFTTAKITILNNEDKTSPQKGKHDYIIRIEAPKALFASIPGIVSKLSTLVSDEQKRQQSTALPSAPPLEETEGKSDKTVSPEEKTKESFRKRFVNSLKETHSEKKSNRYSLSSSSSDLSEEYSEQSWQQRVSSSSSSSMSEEADTLQTDKSTRYVPPMAPSSSLAEKYNTQKKSSSQERK